MSIWNPWHGCKKYSEGCQNCYVYRRDESIGKDASIVEQTQSFTLPLSKSRNGEYKIKAGETVFSCMTSDFFIDEADGWREDAWKMMKERSDVSFVIITKRIVRFMDCIPDDWGSGYSNITIACTVESQRQCDLRLPIFKEIPAGGKFIICEPLLESIDLSAHLCEQYTGVTVGGESGSNARECNFDWILDIREQCIRFSIPFHFKQTGANFVKDGKRFSVPREKQEQQARKAHIDTR